MESIKSLQFQQVQYTHQILFAFAFPWWNGPNAIYENVMQRDNSFKHEI